MFPPKDNDGWIDDEGWVDDEGWTDTVKPQGNYKIPGFRDLATTAAKIPIGLGEVATGLLDLATFGYSGDALKAIGYDPESTRKFIDSFESPELTQAKRDFGASEGFGESVDSIFRNPGLVGLGVLESAPHIAGGAGVARGVLGMAPKLAPRAAGAIGEMTYGAGTQAGQIRSETGTMTPKQIGTSVGSGAVTGLITQGVGKASNKLGLPDLDEILASNAVKGTKRFPALMGSAAMEAVEEAPQSFFEQAALNYATDKPLLQGTPQATMMGGVAGFASGGAIPFAREWSGFGPKPNPTLKDEAGRDLGQGAYAGEERRGTGRPTGEPIDSFFKEYRERLARGEDVRTPEAKKFFETKTGVDDFRKQAGLFDVDKQPDLDLQYDNNTLTPEVPEESFTQIEDEIGDIVVDKQGNEHQFVGMDARGKQIWKLTGKKDDGWVDDTDQVVSEIPPTQEPLDEGVDDIRARFAPVLQQLKAEFGIDSREYTQVAQEFNRLVNSAQQSETPSRMSEGGLPPDKFSIDPDSFGITDPDEAIFQNNASGDSAASVESNRRKRGMAIKNEQYVVYDRAGNERPAIVDDEATHAVNNGETLAIKYNDGRIVPVKHRGGKIPQQDFRTQLKDVLATVKKFAKEDEGSVNFGEDDGQGRPLFSRKSNHPIDQLVEMARNGDDTTNQLRYTELAKASDEAKFNGRMEEHYRLEDAIAVFESELQNRGVGIPARGYYASDRETPSRMAEGADPDLIGMGLADSDPTDIMRGYLNTYSEAGGRVATKELLQNAIDAAQDTNGEVEVDIDHNAHTVSVRDTGPGLTREMIGKEFTNLTGSGKRGGPNKRIGEMGVGKTTYLLGSKKSKIKTVAMEPNGQKMMYEFEGTPEDYYNKTVKVVSTPVSRSTPTGTTVTIWNDEPKHTEASHDYLKQFQKYSNTPVKVRLTSVQSPGYVDTNTRTIKKGYESISPYYNIMEDVIPRTFGGGREIASGTATGGNYRLSIPPQMPWGERNQIALILMNRGMFQGVDSIYVTKGDLPEAVVVEVDPTVDGLSKQYPLTAPTRERLKDSFKQPIKEVINKELVEKAEAARIARLQAAYDSLVPQPWGGHATLDSGGRYTPQELDAFNNSPAIRKIADTMQQVLGQLDALFPYGIKGGQLGRTAKYGFVLGDVTSGGVNIPNPGARNIAKLGQPKEYAVLVNPFASFDQGGPEQAARHLFHVIKHEFNHNRARNEGADFTWKLAQIDAKFPMQSEIYAINQILQVIADPTGGYAPEIQGLLQQHTAARGRPDTVKDLLSEERNSEFVKGPGQAGISGSTGPNGAGVQASHIKPTGGRTTPPINPQQNHAALAQLYQMQQVHKMMPPGPAKQSLYGKIRDFNKTLLTSLDVSGAGRQGLPLIAEKEYWTSMEAMFNSLGSQTYYDNLKDMVAKAPWSQKRYVPVINKNGQRVISPKTGTVKLKELDSFYEEWGLDLTHKEETQGSRLAEKIPGVGASNRAFSGFLTKLRFDTFNRMAQDLLNQGIDIRKDITVGKQLAEFVNNSTGRGDLGKAKWLAPALNEVFFAPRLMAAKVRRYAQVFTPSTYTTMNPMVRKAAFKSLISTAAFGLAFGQLARLLFGAQVNPDPANSDFGKIRIGDTRIDPFGGDQQYLVAMARMLSGKTTSPNNPRYPQQADTVQEYFKNMGTVGGRFTRNKFSPFLGFLTTMFTGTDPVGRKFDPLSHSMEAVIPLVVQDIADIVKEDPNLFPIGILPVLGIGTQSFSANEKRDRRP